MKKKIILVTACLLIAILSSIALIACGNKTTDSEEVDRSDTLILALGDSIAEGILGPSPLIERENYSYLSVVGQINGFTYRNRAISGHTTEQLYKYVSAESDVSAYTHISLIKEADVIVVSILGNDLLQIGFTQFVLEALETPRNYTALDSVLAKSYVNVKGTAERLKELNPKAQLIFQTLYNPMFPGSITMGEKDKQKVRELHPEVKEEDFYNIAGLLLNRLNGVLYDYLKEAPGTYSILEVNAKFDAIYRGRGTEGLDRLMYGDCVHPSNEGHAVIAGLLQERLEDLGIADHDTALKNYKELRKGQLDNLYAKTAVDIKSVKKAIDKETSIERINRVYFDAVEGVTPVYDVSSAKQEQSKKVYVEEDRCYALSKAKILGLDVSGLFDENFSYVKLTKDGKIEVKFTPADLTFGMVNGFLEGISDTDYALDIKYFEVFIKGFFPGESYNDVESAFKKMTRDLGASLEGIDYEEEGMKKLLESIKTEGKAIPCTTVPEDFALLIKNTYEIVEVPSNTHEEGFTYKAVYIGDHTDLGEPYLVLTMFTDEKGNECIRIINEVLSLDVVEVLTDMSWLDYQ